MTRGPILEQVMFKFHSLSALYDFVASDSTPLTEVRRIEVCLESWEAGAIFSIPEMVSEHATDSGLALMVRGALAGRNTRLQELVINSDKFRQIVTTEVFYVREQITFVQEALDRDQSSFLGMQPSGTARCSPPSEHHGSFRPQHINAAMSRWGEKDRESDYFSDSEYVGYEDADDWDDEYAAWSTGRNEWLE